MHVSLSQQKASVNPTYQDACLCMYGRWMKFIAALTLSVHTEIIRRVCALLCIEQVCMNHVIIITNSSSKLRMHP
jgi:hypothetical protein